MTQLKYAIPISLRIKKILALPIPRIIFFTSVLSTIALTIFMLNCLTWQRLALPVTYTGNNALQITPSLASDLGFIQDYVSPCEKIVSFNDIPVDKFLRKDLNLVPSTDKILITEPDDHFSFPTLISKPVEQNKGYLIWSVKAQTLTLDASNCTDAKSTTSASSLPFTNSCSKCIIESPQTDVAKPNLIKLNLDEIAVYKGYYFVQILYLIILLLSCAIAIVFFVMQPQKPSVWFFTLYLVSACLGVGLHLSNIFYFNDFTTFLAIVSFQAISLFEIPFVLLFPDRESLNAKEKVFIFGYTVYSLIIITLEIIGNLNIFTKGKPGEWESTISAIRYTTLIIVALFGIGMFISKYRKGGKQERLKLRLAVYSWILGSIFPLIGFFLNVTTNSLLKENYAVSDFLGAFFQLPSLLIPLVFGYAVLKNKLLGVGLGIRRFAVHSIASAIISVFYLAITSILTASLPFWNNFSQEPFYNVILFILVSIFFQQLLPLVKKFVDKSFSVDPLNYDVLSKHWNNQLLKSMEMETIFEEVICELPTDYHYNNCALVLMQPQILQVFFSISNFRSEGENGFPAIVFSNSDSINKARNSNSATVTLSQRKVTVTPLVATSIEEAGSNCEIQSVLTTALESSFWNQVKQQDWLIYDTNMEPNTNYPAPLTKGFDQLTKLVDVFALIPIKLGDEIYGTLVLGQKSGEFLPPNDELKHLSNLASQIAVALKNALVLQEARQLSQKERELLELTSALDRHDLEITQRATLDIAEAIHGGALQDLFTMRNNLLRISKNLREGNLTNLAEFDGVLESIPNIITELRRVSSELRLFQVQENFAVGLSRLIGDFRQKNQNIKFNYVEINVVEANLLNNILPEQLKLSIFRIIQEAINNAVKHSGAKTIDINLSLNPVETKDSETSSNKTVLVDFANETTYLLEVQVFDDGCGVNEEKLTELNSSNFSSVLQLEKQNHWGINMIKHHIEQYRENYRAQINFYSTREEGFGVVIELYLTSNQQAGVESSQLDNYDNAPLSELVS